MSKIQHGRGGLSSIRNPRTFRNITYRPFPVHQEAFLVGSRNSDYGVSNLQGTDRPISYTIQHDPRKIIDHKDFEQYVKIGIEEPFFPDITISGAQAGGNIFKDIKKGAKKVIKKVGHAIAKEKLISKGATAFGTLATAFGQPELAIPALGVATAAAQFGLGNKRCLCRRGKCQNGDSMTGVSDPSTTQDGGAVGQRVGGRQRFSFDEAIGYAMDSNRRSAKVLHSQTFDPLHPANYPRASLGDLA